MEPDSGPCQVASIINAQEIPRKLVQESIFVKKLCSFITIAEKVI